MENIKALYYRYNATDDYNALGQTPEVLAADKAVTDFMKAHFPGKDYFPLEDMITELATFNEMQGFIYGFRYAMTLMSDCLADAKGGVVA